MAKIERELVLIDSNVLIDVIHADPVWFGWSASHLEAVLQRAAAAINPIIYAEVSAYFATAGEADAVLPEADYRRLPLPYDAGFLAGQVFREYRRKGGARSTTLPDFFIGAHALTASLTLLTRDVRRYRSYFPELRLIAPEHG